MKNLLTTLAILAFLHSCANKPVSTTPTPTTPTPTPVDLRAGIRKIVESSTSCSDYYWKNRGKAPKSYIEGMALMYAKQVCGQGSDFIKPNKITGSNKYGTYNDALNHYSLSGGELNTYTFLIGLGMRESSGKYCTGRDRSQNFTHSRSAEAGLFQMAYVARVFNSRMESIYEKYKSGELSCELEAFKQESIKCTSYDAKTFGTGEGATWQKLMKKCPAFSTQWAAILIRSQYKHFGPIIRKDAEFRTQCRDMLSKVGEISKSNCDQL